MPSIPVLVLQLSMTKRCSSPPRPRALQNDLRLSQDGNPLHEATHPLQQVEILCQALRRAERRVCGIRRWRRRFRGSHPKQPQPHLPRSGIQGCKRDHDLQLL
ncbi:hypothetical protein FKP32DRAFT_984853 [Trametes sanguinea]|nr:hypothetical protein FKP32DRAFT_984853 [Trametes sanguinea]